MKMIRSAAAFAFLSIVGACAGGPGGGSAAGGAATPLAAYRVEAVAPDFAPGADVAGFPGDAADPRAIGAFVGRSVIEGVDGAFAGAEPARLTAVIHRFRPASLGDPAHRVALDYVLSDLDSGEEIGRSGVMRVEAPASGDDPEPQATLATRIARSAADWAADLTCGPYKCPAGPPQSAAATGPGAEEEPGEALLAALFGETEGEAAEANGARTATGATGPAAAPPPLAAAATPLVAPPRRGATGGEALRIVDLPASWDGEPTAGGVWIALPYTPVYRRALIRNPATGETVEATLLWRDPAAGGEATLLSAAAAAALGVGPGRATPVDVDVLIGN
ncbi:MAG: hypothetical protein AAGF90_09495 [Pseudomonadota bacterium]